MPVSSPNYTQLPNDILENISSMGEAELKVVLVVSRQTFGWQKRRDRISLSQLITKTGLSRQGVIDGTAKAIEKGWVARFAVGQSFEYEIVVNSVDQQIEDASQASRPEVVKPVDRFSPKPVKLVDAQKKVLNKNQNNSTAAAEISEVITCYEKNIGACTSVILDSIYQYASAGVSNQWMVEAIGEAVKANARKWAYVEAIVKRWQKDGYKAQTPRRDYTTTATPSPLPIPVTGITPEQRERSKAAMKNLKPFGVSA